jgi:hypothetical protein
MHQSKPQSSQSNQQSIQELAEDLMARGLARTKMDAESMAQNIVKSQNHTNVQKVADQLQAEHNQKYGRMQSSQNSFGQSQVSLENPTVSTPYVSSVMDPQKMQQLQNEVLLLKAELRAAKDEFAKYADTLHGLHNSVNAIHDSHSNIHSKLDKLADIVQTHQTLHEHVIANVGAQKNSLNQQVHATQVQSKQPSQSPYFVASQNLEESANSEEPEFIDLSSMSLSEQQEQENHAILSQSSAPKNAESSSQINPVQKKSQEKILNALEKIENTQLHNHAETIIPDITKTGELNLQTYGHDDIDELEKNELRKIHDSSVSNEIQKPHHLLSERKDPFVPQIEVVSIPTGHTAQELLNSVDELEDEQETAMLATMRQDPIDMKHVYEEEERSDNSHMNHEKQTARKVNFLDGFNF